MAVKRNAEQLGDANNKRLRYDHGSAPHTPQASALEAQDLAVQKAELFLRNIGVCTGVHAAADAAHLRSMASHMVCSGWQGLTEHTWRCCAELNVLLQSFSNRLYEIPVAGCHTWTRAAKATTFDYMAQECQQSTHPRARMQLQMVSHLLNSILRDHLDLSIRKSTLNLEQSPVWLKSWCQRWGFTDHYMSILELEAYPLSLENLPFSIFRGESGSTGQCTVYVPCTF